MSVVGDLVKGVFGGETSGEKAARRGAEAQQAGILAGVEETRRQFDITQEQLEPFREAELRQLQERQALMGLLGPEREQRALTAIQESPGQRFLREQGERSILRGAAATGGLGGGRVQQALTEFGIGTAAQQLNQRIAQLSGQPGTTLAGAQLGAQVAGQIAGGQQAAGQARASGILGAQQVRAGQQQQLLGAGIGALAGGTGLLGAGIGAGGGAALGLLSDARFKTNIKKTSELPSGLPWYAWEWTEEGKEIAGDQPTFGVLSHEAKEFFPDAVIEIDGIERVMYERIH